MVEEPMLGIEKDEDAVYKLVSLVQNEIVGVQLDDILKDIRQSIKQSVESFHASNEARSKRLLLSAWINGIDTKNTYETALQYRHEGTCDWVLGLDKFRAWESGESGNSRLLWIHGPPGFGKTVMSARVIQHLSQGKKAPLSYFFCVADNQPTRDPYAILRSWLAQLLAQDPSVVSAMDSVHKARDNEQTSTHLGLWELFVAVGMAIDGCTFVVDGFDECIDIDTGTRYRINNSRNRFLHDLVSNLTKTNSRVLVVSRDVPDIREYLGEDASVGVESSVEKLEYGITAKDTTADVRSFSEQMVNIKLPKKKADVRHEIAAQAAKRSEGMFLWIKLLEQAISPGQNAKQLVKTVTEMPSGISEAYSHELEKITRLPPDEKDKAVMILRWTLFALLPLRVKELAEALVVSGEGLEVYPDDDLPDCWHDSFVDEDYVKEMILGRCGSLLQLRSMSTEQPLADHTVHFVHFSAQEYLSKLSQNTATSNQLAADLGLGELAAEEAHLSSICLRYLTLNPFEDIPPDTAVYPFLSYAAWAWYFHSFCDRPPTSQDIMRQTQRIFDPATSRWRVWAPLIEAKLARSHTYGLSFRTLCLGELGLRELGPRGVDSSDDGGHENDGRSPAAMKVQKPIYYASLLGLTDVVRWLEDQGLACNCVGGRFGFPLQAAVISGQKDLVRHLLNRGANVSQTGGHYGAAIVAAAAAVRAGLGIVQMLLEAGADLKAADRSGLTALHYAVWHGDLVSVQYLVEHGAKANTASSQTTPLTVACERGHDRVVSFLIDHGAILQGESGAAALHAAIRYGGPEIVSILLSNGVSPDAPTLNGDRPLHSAIGQAATGQSAAIVKLLLASGADPDATGMHDRVPLHDAARSGNIASIEALVDSGAHVDGTPSAIQQGMHYPLSPLKVAVKEGHLEAAKALYGRGANLNQTAKGGLTALSIAVVNGYLEVVAWLLEKGAPIEGVQEGTQQTAFDVATDTGSKSPEVVELLVQNGCFRIAGGDDDGDEGSSAPVEAHAGDDLVMLAYRGNAEGVKMLLSVQTPLQNVLGEAMNAAAACGHVRVVDLLLRHGARGDLQDINGRTALHHAVQHLHIEVANLLVEHSADTEIEDMNGSTPFDLALLHGNDAAGFIQDHLPPPSTAGPRF